MPTGITSPFDAFPSKGDGQPFVEQRVPRADGNLGVATTAATYAALREPVRAVRLIPTLWGYRRTVGTIEPTLRFAIGDFLKSLSALKVGEVEPEHDYEDRRGWANTILGLLGQGHPDDLEMMALKSLALAALDICDRPQDADVIARFERAGAAFLEISPPGHR